MSFPLLDWTGFMLGLEISSDWCEVHVNVIKWASADFGGGMLNCSELAYHGNDFTPLNIHPSIHVPRSVFAQGLHFNLPICCNCFESWLARHIFFKPPPNRHTCICVCVCVCVCVSARGRLKHHLRRTRALTPSHVRGKHGRRALSNTSAVCSPKRRHYDAVISLQIFPSWIWKIQ